MQWHHNQPCPSREKEHSRSYHSWLRWRTFLVSSGQSTVKSSSSGSLSLDFVARVVSAPLSPYRSSTALGAQLVSSSPGRSAASGSQAGGSGTILGLEGGDKSHTIVTIYYVWSDCASGDTSTPRSGLGTECFSKVFLKTVSLYRVVSEILARRRFLFLLRTPRKFKNFSLPLPFRLQTHSHCAPLFPPKESSKESRPE